MRSLPLLLCAAAVLTAASFSGCAGYRLGNVKPPAMVNIETIAVPTFKNETLEPRSSVLVTNAVVKQIQRDGTYRIETVEKADAILRGRIVDFERRQLRSARFDTLRTRELGITLDVAYTLEDSRTGEVLVASSARGTTNLFLDANFQSSERQAIYEASNRVAMNILTRIAEGWTGDVLGPEDDEGAFGEKAN